MGNQRIRTCMDRAHRGQKLTIGLQESSWTGMRNMRSCWREIMKRTQFRFI